VRQRRYEPVSAPLDLRIADYRVQLNYGKVAALRTLPAPMRQEAFFVCWTRKEAYLKARGEGLMLGLDQFDVSLVPGEPATLLGTKGDAQEAWRWSLQELFPGCGYVAALAVEGHDWWLTCWHWLE
jgi:4'-phosphopantetheinyl transferase